MSILIYFVRCKSTEPVQGREHIVAKMVPLSVDGRWTIGSNNPWYAPASTGTGRASVAFGRWEERGAKAPAVLIQAPRHCFAPLPACRLGKTTQPGEQAKPSEF